MTAHVLNLELKLSLGALARTLEGQVLQVVSNTVCSVSLSPGASIYPYSTGGGLGVWGVFSRNLPSANQHISHRNPTMQHPNCPQAGKLTVNPFFKVVVCVVTPGVRVGAAVARPLGSRIPERVEGYAALRNDEASFVRAIRAAAICMCCYQKRKERKK